MSELTMNQHAAASAASGDDAFDRYHVKEHHPVTGTLLGYWFYLMSDCLIFACLFATYAVLGRSYAGGPGAAELFDLKLVAVNTAFLLFSSITLPPLSTPLPCCS
jgi:cytochrome o ubiquinol oxidase subunit 3